MARDIRLISETARQMTALIRRDARERGLGTATFEQRRDAAAALSSDSLWLDADLDLHEAVTMEEGDGAEEVVSEELQAGYRAGDEVIRPAMVRVKTK